MADLVKVTINGKTVEVDRNSTIMEAATVAGVDIPRLCFLKDINETSACRICVVLGVFASSALRSFFSFSLARLSSALMSGFLHRMLEGQRRG